MTIRLEVPRGYPLYAFFSDATIFFIWTTLVVLYIAGGARITISAR